MGLLSPSFEENKMIVEIKVEQNRVGTWDCISFLVDDQYEQNPQTYERTMCLIRKKKHWLRPKNYTTN